MATIVACATGHAGTYVYSVYTHANQPANINHNTQMPKWGTLLKITHSGFLHWSTTDAEAEVWGKPSGGLAVGGGNYPANTLTIVLSYCWDGHPNERPAVQYSSLQQGWGSLSAHGEIVDTIIPFETGTARSRATLMASTGVTNASENYSPSLQNVGGEALLASTGSFSVNLLGVGLGGAFSSGSTGAKSYDVVGGYQFTGSHSTYEPFGIACYHAVTMTSIKPAIRADNWGGHEFGAIRSKARVFAETWAIASFPSFAHIP